MGVSIEISLISLFPSLLLCFLVYKKDRVEKEPLSLLAILFFAGVLVCMPVIWGEQAVTGLVDKMYASSMTFSPFGGVEFSNESARFGHDFLCAFAGIAFLEEFIRWVLLVLITRNNKNFDCLYDGVVYSVFISLGYAVVVNLRHALVDGWDYLVVRAVSTIPLYLLWGIISGVFYTVWHTINIAREKETGLVKKGTLKEVKLKNPGWILFFSLLLPLLFHGVYSLTELMNSKTMTAIFCVCLCVLYVVCFVLIFKMSSKDNKNSFLSDEIIQKLHPELTNHTA